MMDFILGGIEGGATHSTIVLYNGLGQRLVKLEGPGTNHWILGMPECWKRINQMVEHAKQEAGIPVQQQMEAFGLSLSGCEQEETNELLKEGIKEKYPYISKHYVVCSDTVGSIAAAHESGGMVIIAGTGSNALLLNPDGTQARCGGWGHMLGDEGGAWWISHKAMKLCFDEQDNLIQPPFDTSVTWKTIQRHFNIKDRFELLEHCYSKFEKSRFAALCKHLADEALKGDELCRWLFQQAGYALGQYVKAVIPSAHVELLSKPGGLPVVCVGSVWLSWELMKSGFISCLDEDDSEVKELSLLTLATTMATGATYLAAKSVNFNLPRDYTNNFTILYHYTHKNMKGKHS